MPYTVDVEVKVGKPAVEFPRPLRSGVTHAAASGDAL
jgi:hypothetical protein